MNSLYKMCKSIDSKLQKISIRLDSLEEKMDVIELYCSSHTANTDTHHVHATTTTSSPSTITIKTKHKTKHAKNMLQSPSKNGTVSTIEKTGSIKMETFSDKTLITGDTFQKKIFIKKYRGQWSPEHKGWIVSNTQNIKELKKQLKKMSTSFSYIKQDHNIDGSKHDYTDDIPVISQYAFINDE